MTLDPNKFGSTTGATPSQFEQDIQRARGYKPVTQEELAQAYKQYESVGLKPGQSKKSTSDEALYQKAKDTVLAWWKKQKEAGATDPNKPVDTSQPAGPTPAELYQEALKSYQNGQGPNPGSFSTFTSRGNQATGDYLAGAPAYTGSASGGGSGSGGTSLPDTAMSNGPSLTPTQVKDIMRQMGAPLIWKPPSYAWTSEENLKAWIGRAADYANLVLHQNSLPTYNDQYVMDMMASVGLTGVRAASVPMAYRTNTTSLRNYLISLKNAQRLASTVQRQRQLASQLERFR